MSRRGLLATVSAGVAGASLLAGATPAGAAPVVPAAALPSAALPSAAQPAVVLPAGVKKPKRKRNPNRKGKKKDTKRNPKDKTPARYLTGDVRHMANRFTYGYTPVLAKQIVKAGGPQAWFEKQLRPTEIADAWADGFDGWWFSHTADHTTLWQRDRAKIEGGWIATANYARWCLMKRISSNRQVLEMMTEFWENHLHVATGSDAVFLYRADYGRVIRAHALGKYTDLLQATITHPAMGIYLDNAISTKKGVNENLGRELLEIHTVGVGNHTEDDVKNSARLLTGYRVDMWKTFNAFYDPAAHVTGPIAVLGFTHPNTDPDGQAATQSYLQYLARHPHTARRVCQKLVNRFVSDEASSGLVTRLTEVYLKNDTDIRPVLRELIRSDEFARSAGAKVRTPTDDVVATYRVLGTTVGRPVRDESAANAILWQVEALGQQPFNWPRPDGMPDHAVAWSSASRLLASFEVHYSMAAGWWPKEQMTHRSARSWVPKKGARFDDLVDHLSMQLLGRKATKRLLVACIRATGVKKKERITKKHALVEWNMPLLLATVLDTPEHLTR